MALWWLAKWLKIPPLTQIYNKKIFWIFKLVFSNEEFNLSIPENDGENRYKLIRLSVYIPVDPLTTFVYQNKLDIKTFSLYH